MNMHAQVCVCVGAIYVSTDGFSYVSHFGWAVHAEKESAKLKYVRKV